MRTFALQVFPFHYFVCMGFIVCMGCQSESKLENLRAEIPLDSKVIIQVDALSNTKEILSKMRFVDPTYPKKLNRFFDGLGQILKKDSVPGLLCLSYSKTNLKKLTFISRNKQLAHLKIQKKNLDTFFTTQSSTLYLKKKQTNYIFSSAKTPNTTTKEENDSLQQIVAFIQSSPVFSFAVHADYFSKIFGFSCDKEKISAPWVVLNGSASSQNLYINGVLPKQGILEFDPLLFKNLNPNIHNISKLIPKAVQSWVMYPFNNFSIFRQNLATIQKKSVIDLSNQLDYLLDNASQLNIVRFASEKIVILSTNNVTDTQKKVDAKAIDSYQDVSIYPFRKPNSFEKVLSPLVTNFEGNFYCTIQNELLFAKTKTILKKFIYAYHTQKTLGYQDWYNAIDMQLPSRASARKVQLIPTANTDSIFTPKFSVLQVDFDSKSNQQSFRAVLKNRQIVRSNITRVHSIEIENPVRTASISCNTNPMQADSVWIALQDKANQIYLISKEAKLFKKKKLKKPIKGKFQFVNHPDHPGNQILFNTENSVYFIDQNAELLKNFPIRFKKKITQPIIAFDYDNNLKHRIEVVHKDDISTIDNYGNKVLGLKSAEVNSEIINAPKSIELYNRDYILLAEKSGRLNITDRLGKTVIFVSDQINFSSHAWYGFNDRFVSTTAEGNIVSVDTSGQVVLKKLGLSKTHIFKVIPDDRIVIYDQGNLILDKSSIKLAKTDLEDVAIHASKNTIAITAKDSKKDLLYLFNDLGDIEEGFPIKGKKILSISYNKNKKTANMTLQKNSNTIEILEIQIPIY